MKQFLPDAYLRPAEKIDTPYSEATAGQVWPFDKLPSASKWPPSYCTDEECTELSGIPRPSLLALQTAEVVYATKAPIGHGSYRRVWPVHEVAVAAMVNCLKSVANVDFKAVAKISFQAAVITRVVFLDYVKMRDRGYQGFGANLVLAENKSLSLQISPGLRAFNPDLGQLAKDGTLAIPLAAPHGGTWKLIDSTNEAHHKRFSEIFEHARFQGTVLLGNVFQQFERDARKMRT